MPTATKLGIWMDHSNAHLIEFKIKPSLISIIITTYNHGEMEYSLSESESESILHNKKQHQQAIYYKKLEEAIIPYEEVILFGPTNAKTELFNILQSDHRFAKTKIEVQSADKMTENEKRAFVLNHFKVD